MEKLRTACLNLNFTDSHKRRECIRLINFLGFNNPVLNFLNFLSSRAQHSYKSLSYKKSYIFSSTFMLLITEFSIQIYIHPFVHKHTLFVQPPCPFRTYYVEYPIKIVGYAAPPRFKLGVSPVSYIYFLHKESLCKELTCRRPKS